MRYSRINLILVSRALRYTMTVSVLIASWVAGFDIQTAAGRGALTYFGVGLRGHICSSCRFDTPLPTVAAVLLPTSQPFVIQYKRTKKTNFF